MEEKMSSIIKLKDYEQIIYDSLENEDKFLEYLEENQNNTLEMNFSHVDYLKNQKTLSKPQEEVINYLEEVARILDNNDENIFERNLHAVIIYSFYYLRQGFSYMDIVQEGNIGLLKAIDAFGNRDKRLFENYKNFWIIREIVLYIKNELLDIKNNFIKFFKDEEEHLVHHEKKLENKDITVEEITDFLAKGDEDEIFNTLESLQRKKAAALENFNFFKSKNLLNEEEIKVLTLYFGFGKVKRYSIYEIEKELGYIENQGEELFQNALLKLSQ